MILLKLHAKLCEDVYFSRDVCAFDQILKGACEPDLTIR